SGVDTGSLKIRVGVDVGFPVEFVETGDLGARSAAFGKAMIVEVVEGVHTRILNVRIRVQIFLSVEYWMRIRALAPTMKIVVAERKLVGRQRHIGVQVCIKNIRTLLVVVCCVKSKSHEFLLRRL